MRSVVLLAKNIPLFVVWCRVTGGLLRPSGGVRFSRSRIEEISRGLASGSSIAGDPFYREWLCGAGQGCRGHIMERLYIDNCLPLTVELFHQLAFFILSCKPISYGRFKRIDVYIL